ncbi:DUF1127 domain-containing protein [Pseudomonas sp. 5P_3.1_Bac2]|uniref:DUF1127 domain-containing protein n=1 Tax=Pseudomonas sp. 5P_3.1_Bac2 TaxID=2971617 RepID=UPI0021C769B8|nr:DUF1127 domain-containing protein [Pseudomonas sp. 5P_3.1_Bac2]MCU1718894.1 DUF1127 domain-containing protein [Pseudomonas sp. 5P_3.1_Bac2]
MRSSKLERLSGGQDDSAGLTSGKHLYGVAAWRAVWARIRLRKQTRAVLAELSDEQLKDVGLNREQAQREASQPFWR